MLVPLLDEVIELASAEGAREVVIGMAHRGRLNVLAHTVGNPYESILVEFEGEQNLEALADTALPVGGTGDVKYHHGAMGTYRTSSGKGITIRLAANPSHLEYVNPVVEGRARADQTSRKGREPIHDPSVVLPVLIHGDAAFPGQGVVAETLNLQALDGYATGGTVHVITNNQVGFTTDPHDSRSTRYASDLAKGFDVPIIHVNADDVEACISAAWLAFAYRERFRRDALIDLIGYRRLGHNEQDEPAYTQPDMYDRIKGHPTVRQLYADKLVEQGVIKAEEVDQIYDDAYKAIQVAHSELKEQIADPHDDQDTGEHELDRSQSTEPKTAVPAEVLKAVNRGLVRVPDGFTIHRKLKPQLDKRLAALEEDGPIDWAHAESLAFASLLEQGVPIRFTGQDTERGTFSQRHMVLHDEKTGATHTPIQHLRKATAPLELYNSPLSEVACLGFEYGYAAHAPEALVLWEAQFGDFVNSAQVIIDQFLVSGQSKWGISSRLTLLLPHGYEGSGPEHSSARLERFLSLSSEGNIRIANCTTPAQYFHLLRRQALVEKRRPLVVLTPKGLLRLPAATSHLADLAEGQFRPVMDDPTLPGTPRRGHPPGALLGPALLRPGLPRGARVAQEHRHRPRRAALPVREERAARADRLLPEPQAGRLGPGGAAEHGRTQGHVAAPADAPARRRRVPVRGTPAAGQPRRGLHRGAPRPAAPDRARRARDRRPEPAHERVPGGHEHAGTRNADRQLDCATGRRLP